MTIINKDNIVFEIVQTKGNKVYIGQNKLYAKMAHAKTYMTKEKTNADRVKIATEISTHRIDKKQYDYWTKENPWLDLNNFEIVEYELVEKARHKHPLVK